MNHFQDIINLPYPNEEIERDFPDKVLNAAQFAPFAALTGHDAAVEETARLTEEMLSLDELQKEELNQKLLFLKEHLSEHPAVTITHFVKDSKKDGGSYSITKGILKKFSRPDGSLLLEDGTVIPINCLYHLDSDIFPSLIC